MSFHATWRFSSSIGVSPILHELIPACYIETAHFRWRPSKWCSSISFAMNIEPINLFDDMAHYMVILSGCSGHATLRWVFSEPQLNQFCLFKKPFNWWVSSLNQILCSPMKNFQISPPRGFWNLSAYIVLPFFCDWHIWILYGCNPITFVSLCNNVLDMLYCWDA